MSLQPYLPQDRLRSLARGEKLPDRTNGSVLFADISGFTALTESLRASLGTRQGAEELSKRLGEVYSKLIAEVEKYGGSVITFAGDAMMCWFDASRWGGDWELGDEYQKSASRAVACAFGMQESIGAFHPLGLKVAITSGDARRFVVGDPEIQKMDALAGATVTRASKAEQHAVKGDIILDEATAYKLGHLLKIKDWHNDEGGERFAVISHFSGDIPAVQILDTVSLSNDILKSWVNPVIFERETSGSNAFLTEFRPCVALFVRFTGIDYSSDSTENELDAFIREVQAITSRYEGTLLEIIIGDKGSYAYINFGALTAHEDDSKRAVKTALELRKKVGLLLQIGIAQGLMRVGAYGGVTRKSFSALGDDVNLAARLMNTASENEILLSSHVHKAVRDDFNFEPRPPLTMKGKAEPLPAFAVTGERHQRAIRLQEPNYDLPMVGRQDELKVIEAKLDLTAHGSGQVIGIVAEAGLGKSRLVAEVIRSARRKGFVGFGSACQSDGIHTPYLAWKSIWQAFFEVTPEMPLKRQMRLLESDIEDRAPSHVAAIPLLNVVLDIEIPENEFTHNLEPKIRQSALHVLLEDCLKATANDEPTLIVIEDLHWIDALSHDLLDQLAKTLVNHAVCFVVAYRPPQMERLQAPRLEALPQFTRIELNELTEAEVESAIRAKLAQLYPNRGGILPNGLVDVLMRRTQGNPFYLEEMLNYVRDRGLDPADLSLIELPDSLHTLILSRIDQLSEQEKTTLRVASIIGRLFRLKWLAGYYPELGTSSQVKGVLDTLESLDITPLVSPEPELAYLFKHIITHQVTYQSLPFATRAGLHEQLAHYLESEFADALPVEALAFHFGLSKNIEKQREYLQRAGEAAQKNFANDSALEYYGKLLPLLIDVKEQTRIHMQRGQVLELVGKWDDAELDYYAALELAKDDDSLKASAQFALGKLSRLRGDYEPALAWLEQAKEGRIALQDTKGLFQVLIETGILVWRRGEFSQSLELLNKGLALAREVGDKFEMAHALNYLGNVVSDQGDNTTAKAFYEESLALMREVGNKQGIATLLHNLGVMAIVQGDSGTARLMYEESLAIRRETGDKWAISALLHNLGILTQAQADYATAKVLFEESLKLAYELGDKRGIANSLINQGFVLLVLGDLKAAGSLFTESLVYCMDMEDVMSEAFALLGLGLVGLAEDKPDAGKHILHSLRLRQEIGEQWEQTSSLIGVAGLAVHDGKPQFAAQVLGAVASALEALNAVMEVEMIYFHTQSLAAAREALGESAFQLAWEQGAGWSLEEVVNRALGEITG